MNIDRSRLRRYGVYGRKRMMRTLLFFGTACCIAFFSGCVKTPAPELEGLNPVTITVLKEGQPIDGVLVCLSAKGPQGSWSCNGMTNGQGVARIATSVRSLEGNGVKAGTYAVFLIKNIPFPPELEPQEGDNALPEKEQSDKQRKRDAFVKANRIIPAILESGSTTPIELVVAEKTGADLTVELSKY